MKHAPRRFTCTCILAYALLQSGPSVAAEAEWLLDVDAGGFYDSNLTRAQNQPDIRADGAATLAASAGSFFALSGNDGLTPTIDARGEAYHRFHGLNVVGIGGSAVYRHKFGLGYAAPWLTLAGTAAYDAYQQDLRTGAHWAVWAELGQRFNERFDAAIGGVLERRYAQNGEPVVPGISGKVFDLRGESVYLRLGYAATDTLFLGAKVSVRRGDVESTTRRNAEIFEASSAIAADPTFGSDFFGYRLRGTTGTVTLTGSWALDQRSSLNLVLADERTRAYESIGYRSYDIALSYAYRY
jgi:hypothetical protein